jgi:hypothetical protein
MPLSVQGFYSRLFRILTQPMLKRQLSHFNKSLYEVEAPLRLKVSQSVRLGIEPFPGADQILLKFLIIPNLSTRAPRKFFYQQSPSSAEGGKWWRNGRWILPTKNLLGTQPPWSWNISNPLKPSQLGFKRLTVFRLHGGCEKFSITFLFESESSSTIAARYVNCHTCVDKLRILYWTFLICQLGYQCETMWSYLQVLGPRIFSDQSYAHKCTQHFIIIDE